MDVSVGTVLATQARGRKFSSRTLGKSCVKAHICNPSEGKMKADGCPELAGQPG